MVTKTEQIRYNNTQNKLEKALVKNDMLEYEIEDLKKQISDLKKENSDLKKENKELYDEVAQKNEEILKLNSEVKDLSKTIEKLDKKISSLESDIQDFRASKKKDSSNSGKPSSTDGFKRVIQNNRVKSGKNKGGQKGRIGKTLNTVENPDEIINVYGKDRCDCGGKIIYDEMKYIEKQVIDLLNKIRTIAYRYHYGKCEKCGKEYKAEIPKNLANPIQYSDKIKALVPLIRNTTNTSVETTKSIFATLFKGIPFSTGFIHKQDELLAKHCKIVYGNIKSYLIETSVAHADETFIKIDDNLGCCITFSDSNAVIYDMFLDKSKKSFDEFEIFKLYRGILIHDHNKTYYMFALMEHAECNVHICRYLEGVIQILNRQGAIKLKKFLLDIYKEKLEAITQGKEGLDETRIQEIENEYLKILEEWENEYNEATKNLSRISKTLKDEFNLFTRLREYKEEHLKFIKDFRVPFSNNEAERNLRSLKLKMNVSKRFGNLQCAKNFAIIKSIIETAKRQNKDVCKVFTEILNGNYDVFDFAHA